MAILEHHNHNLLNKHIKRLVEEYLSEDNRSLKDILHYSGEERIEVSNTINGLKERFNGKEDKVKNIIANDRMIFNETISKLSQEMVRKSNKNMSSIIKKFGTDSESALYEFLIGRNENALFDIVSEDIALIMGDMIQEGFEEDEFYSEYGEIISTIDNLSDSGNAIIEGLGTGTNVLASINDFSKVVHSDNWLKKSMVNGCKHYAKATGQECNRDLYDSVKDKFREQIGSMILTCPVFLFNNILERNNVSEKGLLWEIIIASLIHPKYLSLYDNFLSRLGIPDITQKIAMILKMLNDKSL